MNTFGEVLNFLRTEILRDVEDPYLFSDESLVEFIAQADDEFAERVMHIRDSTSIVTEVTLEEGVSLYTLNPVVLSVMTAKLDGEEVDMVRAASPSLDGYVPPPDIINWLESINYGVEKEGKPRVWTTDDSTDSGSGAVIRVWPTPSAEYDGQTIKLRVIRLTLKPCSLDNLDDRPEMQRQFVPALCHGAAMRAYQSQDTDAGDTSRSDRQKTVFESYITRAKSAYRRKMFQPLAWGFGRGGFNHSR